MPIYEYVCGDCSARFETMRSMSKADDPICCTECKGHHTKRALSMFATSNRGNGNGDSHESGGHSGGGGCSSCGSHSCGSCGH
jgi:putative FmdB family regulatory protein